MATKNTLFSVDIKKENPLITIIKNGKIPVVRFGNKGFQNYKQKNYYKNRTEFVKGPILDRGCFVHIGGVQGSYISGWHWKENLNIGYVEPDEIIYSTFSYKKKCKEFYLTSAKNRFEEVKSTYYTFLEDSKKENLAMEDFDLYSEGIVDSRHIKKVLVLEPKDFDLLLPWCKDELLRIYDRDCIFFSHQDFICQEFWNHIQFPNAIKEIEEECNDTTRFWERELKYFSDFIEKYRDIILEEFEYYYLNKQFLRNSDYYKKIKKSYYELTKLTKDRNFIKENTHDFYPNSAWNKDKKIGYEFNFYIDHRSLSLSIYYDSYSNADYIERIYFNTTENVIGIIRKNHKYRYYSNDNTEEMHIFETLNLNEIYFHKYRQYLYSFICVYDKIKESFLDVYDFINQDWIEKLRLFYHLEMFLEQYKYEIKNEYSEIVVEANNFVLEYNTILKDCIITIPDSENIYYNLDNLPNDFDTIELYNILEVLKTIDL